MYIRLCSITLLLCMLKLSDAIADREYVALDASFQQRTRADWEKVWHHESHTRCREKLLRHLYWACDNDIYRMERRNGVQDASGEDASDPHAAMKRTYSTAWLDPREATQMLRTRRSRRRDGPASSITAECCSSTGCTWEEYAEYCPSNMRTV